MKRPRNFLFRCELACIGLGQSKLNAFDLLLGKFKLRLFLGEVQKQFSNAILPLFAERLELCNGFFEEFCHCINFSHRDYLASDLFLAGPPLNSYVAFTPPLAISSAASMSSGPTCSEAAARVQALARDPARIVGGQEHGGRDIVRLADPAQRRLRHHALLEIGADEPGTLAPSVSTMPGLMPLTRMRLGPSSLASTPVMASTAPWSPIHRLAGGVMRLTTELMLMMLAPSLKWRGRLGGQQQAQHVGVELPVEMVLGDILQRRELVYPGVVHEDVEPAVGTDGGVDDVPPRLRDTALTATALPPRSAIAATTASAPDLLDA